MDLQAILKSLENCPCGRKHSFDLKVYEADRGLVHKVGEILKNGGFPKKIYIVSDENAMRVSEGILESLSDFDYKLKVYPDMRYAYMSDSKDIMEAAKDFDGILSIGTGSVNDICRYAAAQTNKAFAIFATAPSMDGFASDSAPLIDNNFKISYACRQPSIVIADTEILAASPTELKAAGYGDILGKYVGIVDWKVANYTVGEYYCENIVNMVRKAVADVVAMTDQITACDPDAAKAVLDSLILTGCAMQLAKSTRPASGSEHVVSHFWEIHKLEKGIWPDFHGKKVGLATLLVVRIYKELLKYKSIEPTREALDLEDVFKHYSPANHDEIIGYNVPNPTDEIDLENFKAHWCDVLESIENDLPDADKLYEMMVKAGCVTELADANLSPEFALEALRYSPYMRRRITLLRIIHLLGLEKDFIKL
jgi:glycerol-1-phosphate dehydrogenase [NAD(P)+]